MHRRAARGTLPAILMGAGVGAWYQFLKRPLPRTSGRVLLSGLEAPVDVLRDRFGVPHIRARGVADMFFALMPSLSASSASVCPRATQSGIELPSGRSAKVNFAWN